MTPTPEFMRPFDPTAIDEKTCFLYNYNLLQRDRCVELRETPVMFYDYAFDEDQNEEGQTTENEKGQTTKRNEDMWASLSLERLYQDGGLNHRDFPEMRPSEIPAPERTQFVRVIDFPKLGCCTKSFLKAVKAQMEPKEDTVQMELENDTVDRQVIGVGVMETLGELIPQSPYTFKFGVFFNAWNESLESGSSGWKAFLALMVYIPYFDVSTVPGGGAAPENKTESLSLSEYRQLERGEQRELETRPPSNNLDILVHQAWFMAFNNEMIAMFRSTEDKHSDPIMVEKRPRPLFPGQERVGAFHALAQMISNIFISSRKRTLIFFREKVAKQEFEVRHRLGNTLSPNEDVMNRALDSLIVDIATLESIVQSQLEILEDLRDIYEHTVRAPAKRNCYNKNVVKIPVLHKSTEQITSALMTIDKIVEERKKYHEQLHFLLERAGKSKKNLDRIIKIEVLRCVINNQTEKLSGATDKQTKELLGATDEQTKELLGATDKQTKELLGATDEQTKELSKAVDKQAKELSKATDKQTKALLWTADNQTTELKKFLSEDGKFRVGSTANAIKKQTIELERQRQVVTAFTVLTTLFLPLGFCSSYFGAMNEGGYLNTSARHRFFWKWSGTVTAIILVITMGVILQSHITSWAMKKKAAIIKDPPPPSPSTPAMIMNTAGSPQNTPPASARPQNTHPTSAQPSANAAGGSTSRQNTPTPHLSPQLQSQNPRGYPGRQNTFNGYNNYGDP